MVSARSFVRHERSRFSACEAFIFSRGRLRQVESSVAPELSTVILSSALISFGLILQQPIRHDKAKYGDEIGLWAGCEKGKHFMKRHNRVFLLTLLALPVLQVSAQDIYKCADSDGRVTYSNVPNRSCRKLLLDPVNVAPAARPAPRPAASAPGKTAPSPASFPKVDDQTQKSRDSDRKRILENELAAEQKNVEQARKELAEQEGIVLPGERMQGGAISGGKVQERIQQYNDKLALHQRNVEAISKEIASLR